MADDDAQSEPGGSSLPGDGPGEAEMLSSSIKVSAKSSPHDLFAEPSAAAAAAAAAAAPGAALPPVGGLWTAESLVQHGLGGRGVFSAPDPPRDRLEGAEGLATLRRMEDMLEAFERRLAVGSPPGGGASGGAPAGGGAGHEALARRLEELERRTDEALRARDSELEALRAESLADRSRQGALERQVGSLTRARDAAEDALSAAEEVRRALEARVRSLEAENAAALRRIDGDGEGTAAQQPAREGGAPSLVAELRREVRSLEAHRADLKAENESLHAENRRVKQLLRSVGAAAAAPPSPAPAPGRGTGGALTPPTSLSDHMRQRTTGGGGGGASLAQFVQQKAAERPSPPPEAAPESEAQRRSLGQLEARRNRRATLSSKGVGSLLSAAPFATEGSMRDEERLEPLRRRLLQLNIRQEELRMEQEKLLPRATRTLESRRRMKQMEEEEAQLAAEVRGLKETLRALRAPP